ESNNDELLYQSRNGWVPDVVICIREASSSGYRISGVWGNYAHRRGDDDVAGCGHFVNMRQLAIMLSRSLSPKDDVHGDIRVSWNPDLSHRAMDSTRRGC